MRGALLWRKPTIAIGAGCLVLHFRELQSATSTHLPSTPFPFRCIGIKNTGPPWLSPSPPVHPPLPLPLPWAWLERAPQDRRRLSRSGRRAGRSAGQTSSKASMCYNTVARQCGRENAHVGSRRRRFTVEGYGAYHDSKPCKKNKNGVAYFGLGGSERPLNTRLQPVLSILYALYHLVDHSNPSRPIECNPRAFDHFRGEPHHPLPFHRSPRAPPICRLPSRCQRFTLKNATVAVLSRSDSLLPDECHAGACSAGDGRNPRRNFFRGRALRTACPGKSKVVKSGADGMGSSPFVCGGPASSW